MLSKNKFVIITIAFLENTSPKWWHNYQEGYFLKGNTDLPQWNYTSLHMYSKQYILAANSQSMKLYALWSYERGVIGLWGTIYI